MALVSFMVDSLVNVVAEELVACGSSFECHDLQCRDSRSDDDEGGIEDEEHQDYVYEVKEVGPSQPQSGYFPMLEDDEYDDYDEDYEDELSLVEGYHSSQEEVGYIIVEPPTMPSDHLHEEALTKQMQEQARVKRLFQERLQSYSNRQEKLAQKILQRQKSQQHDEAERLCEFIVRGGNHHNTMM